MRRLFWLGVLPLYVAVLVAAGQGGFQLGLAQPNGVVAADLPRTTGYGADRDVPPPHPLDAAVVVADVTAPAAPAARRPETAAPRSARTAPPAPQPTSVAKTNSQSAAQPKSNHAPVNPSPSPKKPHSPAPPAR